MLERAHFAVNPRVEQTLGEKTLPRFSSATFLVCARLARPPNHEQGSLGDREIFLPPFELTAHIAHENCNAKSNRPLRESEIVSRCFTESSDPAEWERLKESTSAMRTSSSLRYDRVGNYRARLDHAHRVAGFLGQLKERPLSRLSLKTTFAAWSWCAYAARRRLRQPLAAATS
jgi:hypothetical protein